jgi:putative serine protease PepD
MTDARSEKGQDEPGPFGPPTAFGPPAPSEPPGDLAGAPPAAPAADPSVDPAEDYAVAAGPWGPVEPALIGSRRRGRGRGAFVIMVVAASLVAGLIGGIAGGALRDDVSGSTGRSPTVTLPEPVKNDGPRPVGGVTAVADAVLPSVVSIKVTSATASGTGSGFVIDAAHGYVLTNNHVVTAGGSTSASTIRVVFQDGTQVSGKVVGRDASYDLAVVKVEAKGLRQVQLGDSDAVRVGDPVVAIGAPLGLQGTVTTGIVSALNRPVAAGEGNQPAFINAIQTDAAINPGNSGGPLVDATGRVIAVNSAIARATGETGDTGGNIGLGFAIPSNQARRTAQELIRTGKAEHPIIGVTLDSNYTGEGVKVTDRSVGGNPPVSPGGPADRAGIRAGDVITRFNGRPVTESDELIVAIRARTPGETITLTVRRGSTERQVRVKLSAASD